MRLARRRFKAETRLTGSVHLGLGALLLGAVALACGGGGGGGSNGGGGGGPTEPELFPPRIIQFDLSFDSTTDIVRLVVRANDPNGTGVQITCTGDISASGAEIDHEESVPQTRDSQSVSTTCTATSSGMTSTQTGRVTIPPFPVLTVHITGASPDPGVGLVDIDGAEVTLTSQSAAGGLAPSQVLMGMTGADGTVEFEDPPVDTYVVTVRDETGPGIGEWYDIGNPDEPVTVSVGTGMTDRRYVLVPNIPLADGDTFYQNNLDWFQTIQGMNSLHNTAIGMPDNAQSPYRVWINPDNASQQQIAAVEQGILSWNGPNDSFDNFVITDNQNAMDYQVNFVDRGSAVDRASRTISIHRGFLHTRTVGVAAHEASHVLFNQKEDRSEQRLYSSDPASNTLPPIFEIKQCEWAKTIVSGFGRDHVLTMYAID